MKATVIDMQSVPAKLQGRHVLAMFLGFFGIILLVNGYFLYSALSTHTGIVAVEPYRKGLAYNERIAAGEKQEELGWRDTLELGRDGRLKLALADRAGAAVRGLVVTATVGRPSTERFDHKVALAEQAGGGYAVDLGKLEDGAWMVLLEAREASAAQPKFRLRRRMLLQP